MPYRVIDHTADLGLRVSEASAEALFETAAAAMFDQIVDSGTLTGQESREVTVSGSDRADLMVNWLRELLYMWTGEAILVKRVQVRRLSEHRLTASIAFARYDAARHEILTEIKAVTYHQIQVRKGAAGWEARVIFDV